MSETELILAEVRAMRAELAELRGAQPERLYLSPKELADRYGLKPRTVRAWIAAGLPHVRAGRRIRVRAREVDAWLQQRGSTGPAATGGAS